MRTLDQILTKKDYSRKTPASLFYKDSPLWQKLLTIGCVFFLAGAGLGEWKVLNGMLGGLPKAISLGVIGLAMLYTLFYPDEKRLREIWKPTLLYMSLMAALFFWSMVIWIESFAAVPSMIRSCSKLVFQSIAILTAVALVYLFREKAIELFTISICIANTAIMLLSIPGYGLAASLQSLITCLVTFGDDFILRRFCASYHPTGKAQALAVSAALLLVFSGRHEAHRHPGSGPVHLDRSASPQAQSPQLVLPGSGRLLHPVFFGISLLCALRHHFKTFKQCRRGYDGTGLPVEHGKPLL